MNWIQVNLGYMITEEDAVVRRWLKMGVSGWRLDVADELPDDFIVKPNAQLNR